ncbi:DGQHR domain-containing protein DpdB [Duganella fentianensis]|uniref:DGQHR domain-containing protein DpdB n=1 Tax=Duganella fentianensis TaxID=2692177 RepID=UPI0032B1B0A9
MAKNEIVVRALHATQGEGQDLYAFFIRGEDIIKVADISRISRDDDDTLKGFQRPEIQHHVKGIIEYLNQGNVLFPNSIILAMSPDVRFSASRGTKPSGDEGLGQIGTLTIPIYDEGERVAWIVDGQQRSLALAQSNNKKLAVPVIAFISDSLEVQREQFIIVNKAKPLPTRLINELLPETRSVLLPRDLNLRKVPYEICNLLNRDLKSPFYKLIKRSSDSKQSNKESVAVIIDSAVTKMIRNSMNNPLGALYPYKPNGTDSGDIQTMYNIVVAFWSAVRDVFPDAWGKDPRHSRLMHSAGIEAMGLLMDRIYARISGSGDEYKAVRKELEKMAPSCRWTAGTWETIGVAWNELQNTNRDIKKLQDALVRAYTTEVKK